MTLFPDKHGLYRQLEEIDAHLAGQQTGSPADATTIAELKSRISALERIEGESQRMAEANRLLGRFSSLFVSGKESDRAIAATMELCGEFIGADRLRLFRLDPDRCVMHCAREWQRRGIVSRIDCLQQLDTAPLAGWIEQLQSGQWLAVENVENLPGPLRGFLSEQQIQSVLCFPIFIDGRFEYFCEADTTRARRGWSSLDVTVFRQATEVISRGMERKQVESALQESLRRVERIKRQYDAVLRSTPHGICLLNSMNWSIMWANQSLGKIFGSSVVPSRDLIGENFADRFASQEGFNLYRQAALKSLYETGYDKRDIELLRTDGTPFFCEISIVRYDPAATASGLVATITDQTERHVAQQGLIESERRFRSLVQNSSDMLFIFDAEGRVTYCNPALERILGYTFDEIAGRNLFELVHDSDLAIAYDFFGDVLEKPAQNLAIELKFRHRSGHQLDIEVIATNLIADGAVRGVVMNSRDVTERKQAEQALAESEERYRTLLHNMSDALYEVDLAGNITFANPALLNLLGCSSQEIIGKNNREFMDEVNAEKVFDAFNGVYRSGVSRESVCYELIASDGERKTVEGSISLAHDSSGQSVGFLGVIRDITARRKSEEALAEKTRLLQRANQDLTRKNAELDEFTYVASHDLQEPLRKLTAFADLLKSDLGEDLPARAEKDLEFIVDAATRMQALVQALLELSRARKAEMRRERVELDECADLAIEALHMRIEATGAQISRVPLPSVWGDKTMLTQVFQNLIGNSLKFVGADQPEISLTAEKSAGQWVVGVRDNGIGIRPEYAQQIFAPFKRLNARASYEGSGIGLSICRKCVERLGGTIWVESELGQGAHFKFTIGERNKRR